jgi:PAS domain-containing protein/two-component sensor histidine kinase
LAELATAQTLQRAAETLGSADPATLSQEDRDSVVVRALLDGMQASYACVARWGAGADTVRLTGQRRSAPLQETTELDVREAGWTRRVRDGDVVMMDMTERADAVLELLGVEAVLIEPFRPNSGTAQGFLLIADCPSAKAPSPAARTFLDAVARWVAYEGRGAEPIASGPLPREHGAAEIPLMQADGGAIAGPGHGDLLASVIEHMEQGLIVMDAGLTVLAVNVRAEELLRLPPGILMVGASMVDFVRFCAERGDYGPGEIEALVRERIAIATSDTGAHGSDRRFDDGRVVTCSRRNAGNGHIVVTYTDVTSWRESERALAQKTELLEATVQHMDQGLFAFDGDLKVLYANERAKTLLGVPPELFEPGRCFEEMVHFCAARGDYGDGPVEERAAEILAKSRGDEWFTFERRCPGDIIVMVRCHPRPDGGFVVTFTDITQAKRQEQALLAVTDELRAKSAQLDTAFTNMTQGLVIFDADQRLVVCNPRYLELYSLPARFGTPGTEVCDLMRHNARFETGLTVEEAIARRYERVRAGERYVECGVLPGGRVVEFTHQPLEDGGWLGMLTDITEHRYHEQALRDAGEALKQKSNQLERMFNNMGRGVAMFDADRRLVLCNQLYVETFPIPEALAQPGTRLEDIHAHCAQFVVESDVEKVAAAHPRAEAGEGRQEFRLQLVDGRVLEVVREPMEDGGSLAIYQDITDRDRAEQQLRDYAARLEQQQGVLKAILENLGQGVSLVDRNLMMQAINRRGMELLEFPDELMQDGTSLEALFRFNAERGEYGAGDVAELVAARMELARTFTPHRFERTRPDGTVIEVAGMPLPDGEGFVTTYTDVTEMRRHQGEVDALTQKLRTANMQLDAAFNNMNQGLAMFDADQRLVVRNKRYMEMFALPEEMGAPGRTLADITLYSIDTGNEADPEHVLQRRVEIARSRERIVFHRRMADGRTLEIIHEPLEDGGSIAIYLDVTARMEAETRLRDYMTKLEASNRELQDFAYVASHDLQEPLRKIEAFGDRLHRKCGERLGEDGRVYVNRMQDSSRRLRTLINDLLAYSRVTTKAKPFVDVDMNLVFEEVLFDMETAIEETGGKVEVDTMPTLQADDTQMRQLAINLISNAIKFRKPETPPVVRVSSAIIDDPAGRSGKDSWCEITVSDNGIGFSNKYADRIFTIFQRLHSRTTYEGTGIGLATCRKIAERHGGEITADGTPGEGAVFTVRLPRHQAEDPEGIRLVVEN